MKTEKLLLFLGIVVVIFFFFTPLSRPWTLANYSGYSMYSFMTGGMFFGMGLVWILVCVFLLLGIFWFLQQLQSNNKRRR